MQGSANRVRWAALGAALALMAVWQLVFGGMLSPDLPGLGHDHAYMLPHLLAGAYHAGAAGYFDWPWVSPAFCDGAPFLASPQSLYAGLPQWLSLLVDPLTALRWMQPPLALLGGAGTWLLARRLALAPAGAALAAVLFMFNGFFPYRMAIGHVTFHGVMLLPLLGFLLLRAAGQGRWPGRLASLAGAALGFAYLFVGGGVLILPPMIWALGALGLIAALRGQGFWRFVAATALAGLLAMALSAFRLEPVASVLSHFPRPPLPLPGLVGLGGAAGFAFLSLFVGGGAARDLVQVADARLLMGQHEFEFSMTLAPLAALLLWLASRRGRVGRPDMSRAALWAWLALALLLPFIVNLKGEIWSALLRPLPVIAQSSNMFRWWLVWMLPVALTAGLALDAARLGRKARMAAALALVALALGQHGLTSRAYYTTQPFDPRPVTAAWSAWKHEGVTPPITHVAKSPRDDLLVEGGTTIWCGEVLFGYHLETLPRPMPDEGPALGPGPAGLNVRDAACMIWPEANHCAPGAYFQPGRAEAARDFLAWLPYGYARPARSIVAGYVSLAALALTLAMLAAALAGWRARRAGTQGAAEA